MSPTSGSSRQSEFQHQLDAIIRDSEKLPIDWNDVDHRPIIQSQDQACEDEVNAFASLRAMLLDFIEEAAVRDDDLRDHLARALKAACEPQNCDAPTNGSTTRSTKAPKRSQHAIYVSRKANDLELLTTVEPIVRNSCATPLAAVLQDTTTGLETFAGILIEKINELGHAETIGASLLYRGDASGRFLASPLYTVVDLAPDIYAYSASHLVHVLSEEIRRACDVGRVAYVAQSSAHIYKAAVQMTAHCEFRALDALASSFAIRTDNGFDTEIRDDDIWLAALFEKTRTVSDGLTFDVAMSSVSKTLEAATLFELKRKVAQTLKQFFSGFGAVDAGRERPYPTIAATPAPVSLLIQDALAERPGRRVFAAADGGRTVWTSEDAFSGEAP